jgi:polysaccharide export outer membrane protein
MKSKTQGWWGPVQIAVLIILALGWNARAQQAPQADTTTTQAKLVTDQPSARVNGANTEARSDYVIGNGDVLAINVWKEPEVSRTVPVRPDGKISLPLIGEIQASGKTPKQLQADISKGLRDYISEPEVAVIVQEQKSQRFNILGQVQKPGSYLLTNPTTVLDAIAIAGGFRDFAKVKSIKVLRQQPDGKQENLAFNYKQAINGSNPGQNIEIEPGDTIYVP